MVDTLMPIDIFMTVRDVVYKGGGKFGRYWEFKRGEGEDYYFDGQDPKEACAGLCDTKWHNFTGVGGAGFEGGDGGEVA